LYRIIKSNWKYNFYGRLYFAGYAADGVIVDARVYSYAIALAQATKQKLFEPDLK